MLYVALHRGVFAAFPCSSIVRKLYANRRSRDVAINPGIMPAIPWRTFGSPDPNALVSDLGMSCISSSTQRRLSSSWLGGWSARLFLLAPWPPEG